MSGGRKALGAGIVGTGAISHKHAQAYANIGFRVWKNFHGVEKGFLKRNI